MNRPDNGVDDGVAPLLRSDPRHTAIETADLRHEDVRAVLSDFDEETLAPHDHARVAEHLEWCSSCRSFLNTLRATVQLVGDLREEREAPAEARQRLLSRFLASP